MDKPEETSGAKDFRTPPRILIPKLVESRDKWKAKATERRNQYRAEKIHSRDLGISRDQWKGRALAAEQKVQELQLQLQQAQADLAQARADLAARQDAQKK
jgi:hypothetical protein